MTKKTKDSLEYSGKNITSLEFPENIRTRPTMYIGTVDNQGVHTLLREVLDNSCDEAGQGFGKEISVAVCYGNNTITVIDGGRGIPHEINKKHNLSTVEVSVSVMHASGKFDSAAYATGKGGLNGIGLKAVNALSSTFEVQSYRDGKVLRAEYKKGKPVAIVNEDCESDTGTVFVFSPDPEIFTEAEYLVPEYEELAGVLESKAYLLPGVTFNLVSEDEDGKVLKQEAFLSKNGLTDYVDVLIGDDKYISNNVCFDGIIDVKATVAGAEDTQIHIDVAMGYQKGYDLADTHGFTNGIYQSEGGTHITGFKSGLTKIMTDYIAKAGLLKGKDAKLKLDGTDFLESLVAVISIKHDAPLFKGQDKQKVSNTDIPGAVRKLFNDKFDHFINSNPKIAKKIADKAIAAARGRVASLRAKETIRKSNDGIFSMNSASKLTPCKSKNPEECEIFICEGRA